jgi:hypothetical protein
MPDSKHPSLGLPVPSYCGSGNSTLGSKQRHGQRMLMKLSIALTTTCTLLFLIVCVPHLHSHFYLISGSSAPDHGLRYAPSDLAGLSDRIVPYKMRIGYFTYAKPLVDDRVIAVYPPHYVPGADVRDQFASMRGLRPAVREVYIDDLGPVVLRISPKVPTGGMVSLVGLRFGPAGSVCNCKFGGVAAQSCEVKSPELAIIQLPPAVHLQIYREANAQPAFIEVDLSTDKHLGVSRIHFGSVADADHEPPIAEHAASPQVLANACVYFSSRALKMTCTKFTRSSRSASMSRLQLQFAAAKRMHRAPEPEETKRRQCRPTRKFRTFPAMTLRESLLKHERTALHDASAGSISTCW